MVSGGGQHTQWATYRRSMSSRILSASALLWVWTRYFSTQSTKWSLNLPLMSWWRISGESISWMSAHGKSLVNGYLQLVTEKQSMSLYLLSNHWQVHIFSTVHKVCMLQWLSTCPRWCLSASSSRLFWCARHFGHQLRRMHDKRTCSS